MANIVFIETFTTLNEFKQSFTLALPIESLITYSVYKYCLPQDVQLKFVVSPKPSEREAVYISENKDDTLIFADLLAIPWHVSSCIYPVALYDDVVITGLCGVARHITKYRTRMQGSQEHEDGLLGFRKSCLQAPNEASIWTKFCEVDIIKTVKIILANENGHSSGIRNEISSEHIGSISKNLSRFENHLKKPVRVHNVYKIARNMKKNEKVELEPHVKPSNNSTRTADTGETIRVSKPRKWKSNAKKIIEINSSTKIEDLGISHQFAEGPFFTLADVILLPSYYIVMQALSQETFKLQLPLTFQWFTNLINQPETRVVKELLNSVHNHTTLLKHISIEIKEDASLYKRDPARHNPKKRLFTKEDDIINALSTIVSGMKLDVSTINYTSEIDWNSIPDGANPNAGHLPDTRTMRKSQQLENLTLAVLSIAKEGDVIVDFCSGSGHLGILIAYLLPKCTIILLENKEQSLLKARKRVHDMNLRNIIFFQCNVDFFIGKFNIGVALHACGIATDLVLDKCLKAKAKFVLCPCCYGSLHSTDRMAYPRSITKFSSVNIDQYMCIGHAADQTHEDHPLMERGSLCMAIIDSDRARLAEEFGYKVTLSRLKPLSCTPKNNLLIGIPA